MKQLSDNQKQDLEKEIALYLDGRNDLTNVVEAIEKYQRSQYDTFPYWNKLSEAINQKIFGRYERKES